MNSIDSLSLAWRTLLATCGAAAIALTGAATLASGVEPEVPNLDASGTPATVAPSSRAAANARSLFDKQEVDIEAFIAMAAPRGRSGDYYLMIVEQETDESLCWSEQGTSPTEVQPLLLTFDFTGICGRKADSNAYSIRMADRDLGLHYSLRVVQEGDELFLRGYSNLDFSTPPIEIGRTQGISSTGFTRISLNPGWRLTRRMFEETELGHIYLTSDLPLTSTEPISQN
ncbi:DUF3747 domain-containing protein [Synechococcus sp. PCC 7336]|uniref:DUF3747 domain-containing protein n=1 Tax=Synechococcus sp. PCC 7336 TaxID=195250 RepID=UPI00034C7A95|nr:DUF3747 domain-containing protein [Synechococcus sp. PCC 7336]